MLNMRLLLALLSCFIIGEVYSQGPPITADKPIMLGAKRIVFKTLTEISSSEEATFVKAPLMIHYLPTSNFLIGAHIPLVNTQWNEILELEDNTGLGDIDILIKYQFFRKDKTGKTFRMVAKAIETIPINKTHTIGMNSMGVFQSYLGIVAGLETLKYGISNEVGYRFVAENQTDIFTYKLGFGLPLLKPTYPVKQINLYFEYANNWAVETGNYELLYAQGIQYAIGRITIEASIQMPLVQTIADNLKRKYSLFLGTRFII